VCGTTRVLVEFRNSWGDRLRSSDCWRSRRPLNLPRKSGSAETALSSPVTGTPPTTPRRPRSQSVPATGLTLSSRSPEQREGPAVVFIRVPARRAGGIISGCRRVFQDFSLNIRRRPQVDQGSGSGFTSSSGPTAPSSPTSRGSRCATGDRSAVRQARVHLPRSLDRSPYRRRGHQALRPRLPTVGFEKFRFHSCRQWALAIGNPLA